MWVKIRLELAEIYDCTYKKVACTLPLSGCAYVQCAHSPNVNDILCFILQKNLKLQVW